MNRFCWVMVAGLLIGDLVGAWAEPAKTNNPPATPATKAPASPADQMFALAQAALKKADYPAGRRLFGEFAGLFPADGRVPEAQFLKGMCELKGGPQGAALTTWKALVAMQPQSDGAALALEQMALYYEQAGPPARVEELLNRLKTSFPTNAATARLWTKRGDMLFEAKKYGAAVQAWESVEPQLTAAARQRLAVARALGQGAADPRGLLEAANASVERNEPALAIGLYEAYLERFPKGPEVREAKAKLGWAYYIRQQGKDVDRAEALWKEVIAQGPAHDPWVGESQWHMVQLLAGPRGKWEEAARICTTIIKNFPVGTFRNEQALFVKAWLYSAKKQWAPARAAWAEFLAAYPEKKSHPPILEYIADCEKNLTNSQKGTP